MFNFKKFPTKIATLLFLGAFAIANNPIVHAQTMQPENAQKAQSEQIQKIQLDQKTKVTVTKIKEYKVKPDSLKFDKKPLNHVEVGMQKVVEPSTGTVQTDTTLQSNIIVQPNTTVVGLGGSATIDPSQYGIWWKVKPATDWPYYFSGQIEVDYYDGTVEIYSISGYGALGSSLSSDIELDHSGGYSATLTGEADDMSGGAFVVLPGCTGGFGY